jgi:predicted O-linked N-acetylglucosamine transferase (SPINDLY family)
VVGSRPELFALRPAPVSISWMGYPGTLGFFLWEGKRLKILVTKLPPGASFMDFIVCDRIACPRSMDAFYSEKIIRLVVAFP